MTEQSLKVTTDGADCSIAKRRRRPPHCRLIEGDSSTSGSSSVGSAISVGFLARQMRVFLFALDVFKALQKNG